NKKGKSILKIIDNEWWCSKTNWDIEITGTKITIRECKGKYDLILNKKEDNFIEIERINMKHKDVNIYFDGKNGGEFTYNDSILVVEDLVYLNSKEALKFQNGEIILNSTGDIRFKSLKFYKKKK
ncbi:MAG: hypothetical protein ACRCR2_03495, partial [Fusobacteriaceae bacterium]